MPDRLELPDDELININGGVDVLNIGKDSVKKHEESFKNNDWLIEKGGSTATYCYKCSNVRKGLVYGIKYMNTLPSYTTGTKVCIGNVENFTKIEKPTWIF